jgi:tetratricopeptide (TPR) repeat protein
MTSDDDTPGKKNLNPLDDLELDDDQLEVSSEDLEDIDEIEEIIDATPLGSELDNKTLSASDGDDFDAELSAMPTHTDVDDMPAYDTEDEHEMQKGGGMKKMLAPALVLAIAAGAAGYIMMNPAILGGGGDVPNAPIEAAQSSLPAAPLAMLTDEDEAKPKKNKKKNRDKAEEELATLGADIPQPAANLNADTKVESEVDVVLSPDEAIEEIIDMGDEIESSMSGVDGEGSASVETEVELSDAAEFSNDLPKEVSVDAPKLEVADVAAKTTGDLKAPRAPEGEIVVADAEAKSAPSKPKAKPVDEQPKAADENDIFEEDFQNIVNEEPVTGGTETKAAAPSASENNSFYDSEARVPSGQIAGPRKLDPRVEPATNFVVATKNYDAQDQESLVVAANRALKLRRYDAARDMFDSLYEKNKRDKRILMGLAIAQQNTGRVESAIKTYEELLDIDPDNADALVNMLGLIREQYPSVALRRLMDLQQRFPNNAGVAAQIGITQADLGQYAEAVRYLGAAASLEPQNAHHLFNLAIVTDRQGRNVEAIQYYEQALEVDTIYSTGQSLPRETIYDRLSKLRRR